MEKYNVLIAYDLNSNKTDTAAWNAFKELYEQYLAKDVDYPQSTAVLTITAANEDAARQKVIKYLKEWISIVREAGLEISISKFLITVCGKVVIHSN